MATSRKGRPQATLGGSGPTASAMRAFLKILSAMARAKNLWETHLKTLYKKELGKITIWLVASAKSKLKKTKRWK